MSSFSKSTCHPPKMGPEPVLLSRKEVDMLYITLQAVSKALDELGVEYIVTGGSLLGAIRQHSILFCDDDIDIAIIERDGATYEHVSNNLQRVLGKDFMYSVRPWEGGDRIRPRQMSSIFLDLFTIRRFESVDDLVGLIGVKKNGKAQSDAYVKGIVDQVLTSAHSQGEQTPLCPFWHFDTRKAVEMWPKEVYREHEMFPLSRDLKFGPLSGVHGPRSPVTLLKRAFGRDCFEVYFQSASHKDGACSSVKGGVGVAAGVTGEVKGEEGNAALPPLVQAGGTWEGGRKAPLLDEHYLPMQPVLKAHRRHSEHDKESLFAYLLEQAAREEQWELHALAEVSVNPGTAPTLSAPVSASSSTSPTATTARPRRTVYMDGVFDLFHIGHLEAIRQCAALGDRVIIGVTGDDDAAGYKRPPIISQANRVAVVEALREVDSVVCPCPLVVTEDFMALRGIDLVVHGFSSDADAARQEEFFAIPMRTGRFQRIGYYDGLSTTDIISKIKELANPDDKGAEGLTVGDSSSSIASEGANNHGAAAVAAAALALKKPQWFGAALAAATLCSPSLSWDPFPLDLRVVIEPFVRKAATRREEVLGAVRVVTGAERYDEALRRFSGDMSGSGSGTGGCLREGEFSFDREEHKLREAFLASSGLAADADLSRLHEDPEAKDELFAALTKSPGQFQQQFDRFVTAVCAPFLATLFACDDFYYQAFPCIRVVQPDDFSIGPHADAAYGHHPCSVNFYVPLTDIADTSSLYLESRPGAEDWHPIVGGYGMVKHFAGAMCAHWTAENKTGATRVSLDFRLIPGPLFLALQCGGGEPGGQLDVYRQSPGYYSHCSRFCIGKRKGEGGDDVVSVWERLEPLLLPPDERVGFPWTVRNMDKHVQRSRERRLTAASASLDAATCTL